MAPTQPSPLLRAQEPLNVAEMAEAVAAYLHDSPASARKSDFQPGVILPSPS